MAKTKRSIEQTNPIYKASVDQWQFFDDSYVGGKQYIQSDGNYLVKHTRESQKLYDSRKSRAFFINYCQAIIDTYKSHLNKKEPIVEVKSDNWEDFTKDVNRKNDSYVEFRHDIQVMAMVLGHTFVLVDKPNFEAETKAEEIEKGLPFFVHVPPWAVLDWAVDDFGKLYWVKIKELDRSVEPDAFKELSQGTTTPRGKVVFKYWFRDRWEKFNSEGVKIDDGVNPLGEVPLVIVLNRKSSVSSMTGISALNDIAFINKRVYNLSSLIDEFAYMTAFPMIKNPVQMNQKGETVKRTGSEVLFNFPDTARHPPDWMSPPTEPMKFLSEQINDSIHEMHRLARVEAGFDLRKRQNESGISKSFDWLSTSAVLSEKAGNFEEAEESIIRLWLKWQDEETKEFDVAYPDSFDIKTLEKDLDDVTTMQTMEISSEFEATQLKKLVRKADPHLVEKELKIIDDQIDENVRARFEERAFIANANNDIDNNE